MTEPDASLDRPDTDLNGGKLMTASMAGSLVRLISFVCFLLTLAMMIDAYIVYAFTSAELTELAEEAEIYNAMSVEVTRQALTPMKTAVWARGAWLLMAGLTFGFSGPLGRLISRDTNQA